MHLAVRLLRSGSVARAPYPPLDGAAEDHEPPLDGAARAQDPPLDGAARAQDLPLDGAARAQDPPLDGAAPAQDPRPRWIRPEWRRRLAIDSGFALFAALTYFNVSTFGFHVIVSRLLGPARYGALGAVLVLTSLAGNATGAVSTAVTRTVAVRRGRGRMGRGPGATAGAHRRLRRLHHRGRPRRPARELPAPGFAGPRAAARRDGRRHPGRAGAAGGAHGRAPLRPGRRRPDDGRHAQAAGRGRAGLLARCLRCGRRRRPGRGPHDLALHPRPRAPARVDAAARPAALLLAGDRRLRRVLAPRRGRHLLRPPPAHRHRVGPVRRRRPRPGPSPCSSPTTSP